MLHFYYRDTESIWSCCTPAAFRPTSSSCASSRYRCYCFLIAHWCWLCCIPTVLLSYWVTFVTSRHRTAMSPGECWASCGHCWLVKGETCSNLMQRSVRNSILQPCYSNSCRRCIRELLPFSETAVHTARRWGEGRPRDTLSKTAVELSHTATRYSHGKAFLERDRFLNNRTTLPGRSLGSGVPAAPAERGDSGLQRGAPVQNAVVYKMAPQWRLSSIIYPKYQTARKGLVDLLVWLKWVKVCLAGLGDVQSVRKRLFTAAGLFVGWITYLWNSLHNRTKTKREKNTFVGVLKRKRVQQKMAPLSTLLTPQQTSTWGKSSRFTKRSVWRARFIYFRLIWFQGWTMQPWPRTTDAGLQFMHPFFQLG